MPEFQNNKDIKVNSFNSGLNKDLDPSLFPQDKGLYSHALNARLNSQEGNSPTLQNEPSNFLCADFPEGLTLIGSIPIFNKQYAVFFTDNLESEIGIFDDNSCTYTKKINNRCLNFNTSNLIQGVAKENFDCSTSIYFTDNNNSRRVLNLDNIPYKFTLKYDTVAKIDRKIYTDQLDCDALLVHKKLTTVCLDIKLGGDGSLKNGSYQVAIAYSEQGQRVSDYMSISNPQSIWSHDNLGRSIEVDITSLDLDFSEYTLVVIYTINEQTTVEIVGYYSTGQNRVVISRVGNEAIGQQNIPLSEIFTSRPYYEKAQNVASSNGYLLWTEPTTRKELNYQKLANDIRSKWIAYRVPSNYYAKGGNKVSYMRDEVYPFGIQWLYSTGEWSPAYHIPGRPSLGSDTQNVAGVDIYEFTTEECIEPDLIKEWQAYNTATSSNTPIPESPCEEVIIGEGDMAYWESTEKYPDNIELFPELANKSIRHHKFPDNCKTHIHQDNSIVLLGIAFENIKHPLDELGKPITDIVKYRIVRGERDKSVLAKGLIFNVGEYDLPTGPDSTVKALYPNYPYNDLRVDPYLSTTLPETNLAGKETKYTPMGTFRDDIYTFHSPATSFGARISLGSELKIEMEEVAQVDGYFEPVQNHPRHKLLRNFALLASAAVGMGEALLNAKGKTTYTKRDPTTIITSLGITGQMAGTVTNLLPPAQIPAESIAQAIKDGLLAAAVGSGVGSAIIPLIDIFASSYKKKSLSKATGSSETYGVEKSTTETAYQNIPTINIVGKVVAFGFLFAQGVDTALQVIKAFVNFQQYAWQYNSHGLYNVAECKDKGQLRRKIVDYEYLYPVVQSFDNQRVNNFNRESSVIIKLNEVLKRPRNEDTTRQTIASAGICKDKRAHITTQASSYYVSVKQKRPNQYGQLESIRYMDTGTCLPITEISTKYKTDTVFGGDTYINKMSHKRKMHFFNQTEFKELDGHEWDYTKYINIPYPRYWMNTESYDVSELLKLQMPTDKHNLECRETSFLAAVRSLSSPFVIKDAQMYLFVNGVIEYFVESDYNLDYRDWEEQPFNRHYDPIRYTDLSTLFKHDYQSYDNRYLYDLSLSKQLTENYIGIQDRNYNPLIYNTCYTSFSSRVIYSLPSSKEQKRDNWAIYLANNYYDFPKENGPITGIIPLDKTNILFLFENSGPYLHRSIDELQTDSGDKITIGDGGLFARMPQALITTDYGYGSCQSRYAFSNTHFGLFYPSQRQGRVFLYNGKLTDISRNGMHFWFKEFLPSQLLKAFPEYKNKDNTINGTGLLSAFDSNLELYYLCKIDYTPKTGVVYNSITNSFSYLDFPITLGDPTYFEDASWTISYDPKTGAWVSLHDWHPQWIIQTENHFISLKEGFWKHNDFCEHFCNFYNIQYPFELEFVVNNGQSNELLSSVEYNLEAHKYFNNCKDVHHLLDYNFNQAIIYNSEQISGLLRLNLKEKNKMSRTNTYPIVNGSLIDIEYAKEEQKYRFSQFWDITSERGEFTNIYNPMFVSSSDGYHRVINSKYIDYQKRLFERKRLRHLYHKILLRRIDTKAKEMPQIIFKFFDTKETKSFR